MCTVRQLSNSTFGSTASSCVLFIILFYANQFSLLLLLLPLLYFIYFLIYCQRYLPYSALLLSVMVFVAVVVVASIYNYMCVSDYTSFRCVWRKINFPPLQRALLQLNNYVVVVVIVCCAAHRQRYIFDISCCSCSLPCCCCCYFGYFRARPRVSRTALFRRIRLPFASLLQFLLLFVKKREIQMFIITIISQIFNYIRCLTPHFTPFAVSRIYSGRAAHTLTLHSTQRLSPPGSFLVSFLFLPYTLGTFSIRV